jgi:hypothetical protein
MRGRRIETATRTEPSGSSRGDDPLETPVSRVPVQGMGLWTVCPDGEISEDLMEYLLSDFI